jgi:hypothetical protein
MRLGAFISRRLGGTRTRPRTRTRTRQRVATAAEYAAFTTFAAFTVFTVSAESAMAQMPGAPVLQNAWAAPGVVAAIDLSGGSGGGPTYAAALGWAPASARFQLSGGLGAHSMSGEGTRTVYGLRAAIPFGGASSPLGVAAFAGVGGGSTLKSSSVDSVASTTEIPLGVAIGWRRAIGGTHRFSAYAAPSYVLFSGGTKSGGLVRAAIGADVGLTASLGATLGVEFGGTRARGLGGPTGTLFGLGISYALGRR